MEELHLVAEQIDFCHPGGDHGHDRAGPPARGARGLPGARAARPVAAAGPPRRRRLRRRGAARAASTPRRWSAAGRTTSCGSGASRGAGPAAVRGVGVLRPGRRAGVRRAGRPPGPAPGTRGRRRPDAARAGPAGRGRAGAVRRGEPRRVGQRPDRTAGVRRHAAVPAAAVADRGGRPHRDIRLPDGLAVPAGSLLRLRGPGLPPAGELRWVDAVEQRELGPGPRLPVAVLDRPVPRRGPRRPADRRRRRHRDAGRPRRRPEFPRVGAAHRSRPRPEAPAPRSPSPCAASRCSCVRSATGPTGGSQPPDPLLTPVPSRVPPLREGRDIDDRVDGTQLLRRAGRP